MKRPNTSPSCLSDLRALSEKDDVPRRGSRGVAKTATGLPVGLHAEHMCITRRLRLGYHPQKLWLWPVLSRTVADRNGVSSNEVVCHGVSSTRPGAHGRRGRERRRGRGGGGGGRICCVALVLCVCGLVVPFCSVRAVFAGEAPRRRRKDPAVESPEQNCARDACCCYAPRARARC